MFFPPPTLTHPPTHTHTHTHTQTHTKRHTHTFLHFMVATYCILAAVTSFTRLTES